MKMSENIGKILWGLLFLVGAVYLIASRVWKLPTVSVFSVILTVFLAWLFIEGLRHLNFWEILFPIAFFCIIYAKPLGITNMAGSNSEQCNGENLNFDNTFSESIKYINTDNLCTVSVDNSFGSTSVYFDNAIIQGESASVYIDNSFGEISLYVPRAWNVDVNVEKAFGNVNMRGRMEGTSTHRLLVSGETNFGTLTIVFI